MKLSQLLEDKDGITAIRYLINKKILDDTNTDTLSTINVSYSSLVTSLGNFADIADNISPRADMRLLSLSNLKNIDGIPILLDGLTISDCDTLTDVTSIGSIKKINSISINKCAALKEITIDTGHVYCEYLNISEMDNLNRILIAPGCFSNKHAEVYVSNARQLDSLQILNDIWNCTIVNCKRLKLENIIVNAHVMTFKNFEDRRLDFETIPGFSAEIVSIENFDNTKITGLKYILMVKGIKTLITDANSSYANKLSLAFEQAVNASNNMRIRVMTFTKLMTEAGLEHML